MKILLLGGTGAMGIHLTNLLASEEKKIFVTTRRKKESNNTIEYIQGDAKDIVFLKSIFKQNWDVVVDFMSYNTDQFKDRIDLFLTSTKQYIFISSARVYSESKSLITESTPRLLDVCTDEQYLKTDEYALTKARQEDLLKKSKFQNWTIVRPSITYDTNRLQLGVLEKESWIYRAIRGRSIVFSNDIAGKITAMTHGYDVAKGITSIIGKSKAHKEVFHITSPEVCSWNQILKIYLDVLEKHTGTRPKIVMTQKSLNLKFNKYQVIYSRYFNRKFNNEKINQFTDVEKFKKVEEGLKESLVEFLQKPSFLKINWKLEAMQDKVAREFTPISEIPNLKNKIIYLLERYNLSFLKKIYHLFRPIFLSLKFKKSQN